MRDKTITEALAVHEMLRKLQFLPREIFIMWGPDQIHVVLRAQDKEFGIYVGPSSMGEEVFRREWKESVEWWNSDEDRDLVQEAYDTAESTAKGTGLVQALVERGFTFRNVEIVGDDKDVN